MNLNKKIQTVFGALLVTAVMDVSAIPITGDIGMGGAYQAVDTSWNATTNGLATGIAFTPELFIVNSTTGIFATEVSSQIGTISSFQFAPGLGISDGMGGVTAVSLIADFWTIDGFSFELASVTNLAAPSSAFLNLQGTGTISHVGYDDTMGTWSFTGNSAGSTFSWSAGSSVAVPEPGMLALMGMGIGLIGFVAGRRR